MDTDTDTKRFRFSGELWKYAGPGGWYFVTLSASLSKRIKKFVGGDSAPWGSVKVEVQVNATLWNTSIFPDRKRGAYLLPIKSSIRKALEIGDGDSVSGTIDVHCERL